MKLLQVISSWLGLKGAFLKGLVIQRQGWGGGSVKRQNGEKFNVVLLCIYNCNDIKLAENL